MSNAPEALLARLKRGADDVLQEGLSPLCNELAGLVGQCSRISEVVAGLKPEDAAEQAEILRLLAGRMLEQVDALPPPEQIKEALVRLCGLTARVALHVAEEISDTNGASDNKAPGP